MRATKVTNIDELMDMILQAMPADEVAAELKAAQKRKEAAEREAREQSVKQKKIDSARNDVINAWTNYVKVISPAELSEREIEDFRKVFDSELKYLENGFLRMH